MMRVCMWRLVTVGICCAALHLQSLAQGTGAQGPVKLGRSSSLSGPIQANATLYNVGADVYFKAINAAGGVKGRQVEIVDMDDAYKPDVCIENTRKFIGDPAVVGLFQYMGTPTINAAYSEISKSPIALIGGISGGDVFKDAAQFPYLYVVRANYALEVEKMIAHNKTIGITRFAVFYQDDEFGKGVLTSAEKIAARSNVTIVARAPIQRGSVDVEAQAAQLIAAAPQAILMFVTAKPGALLVQLIKSKGMAPQFMTLSTVSVDVMARDVPSAVLEGIGIVQVVPSPRNVGVPLVTEYQKLLSKYAPAEKPSYLSLEGFLNAKVTVEALKRIRGPITRQSLIKSIEGFDDVDLGGVRVKFNSPTRRGSHYTDLSVVGPAASVRH